MMNGSKMETDRKAPDKLKTSFVSFIELLASPFSSTLYFSAFIFLFHFSFSISFRLLFLFFASVMPLFFSLPLPLPLSFIFFIFFFFVRTASRGPGQLERTHSAAPW